MNGLLEPTKHHPLKIILKALVDLGYLKTTKLSSKYVPTDPILALTIYEPTQKMIDSASQTA